MAKGPQNKAPKKRRGGLLIALGAAFAASVVLRLSHMEFDFVSAAEASDPEVETSVVGPASPIRAALDEVEALRSRLTEREAELDDRERAVEAAQMLVEARLAELEAAEQRLEALIQLSDQAAENDLSRLTDVYQAMAPGEAAALFAQMDPNFASGFLSRMSTEASAAIMAELPPDIAYAISIVIATRNAGAPTLEDSDPSGDPDADPDT